MCYLKSCVYCMSYELRVIFIALVTSYFLYTSYELLFIARVTSYFLRTSYKLLFIARVTSYFYCLLHKLRVIVYCQVNFYMRVRSYFLTMSYSKDKDDKAVYDNKVMIRITL